jgi:hypothetical protein
VAQARNLRHSFSEKYSAAANIGHLSAISLNNKAQFARCELETPLT